MSALQEIFQRYAPEYLERYRATMPAWHKKVIHAILHCRTGEFGANLYRCDACGQTHVAPCSCGNRHCPTCQHAKAAEWLDRQMKKLLPCPYFLITFTVPQEVRPFVRRHQKLAYSALFHAASAALSKLARDPRFVGADQIGCFGVLHTWGRQLQYHPHLHFIVPGGGLSRERDAWIASKAHFFIRVEPLSLIYRAKVRDAIARAGLLHQIDPTVWQKPWVVNSQAVGDGSASLRYLSAYVFRVALSNSRIVNYDDHQVTFRYRKVHSPRWRKTSLDAMEFIRRFLQHVLPTGFMKIRHYGFLSANPKTSLQKIREMISVIYEVVHEILEPLAALSSVAIKCPRCGHPLRWSTFVRALLPP